MSNELQESQRYGRNKETLVDYSYLNTGKYRKKFDNISNNKKLSRLLYANAKAMLKHRAGTKFEDMCWIDLDSLLVIAQEYNCKEEKQIIYSDATKRAIQKSDNILTMHTHPDSFPPSINDINSNFENSYAVGIVLCHDGTIYMYSANEPINEKYYQLVVEKYLKNGYTEEEAQLKALSDMCTKFDMQFKEVTGNESI